MLTSYRLLNKKNTVVDGVDALYTQYCLSTIYRLRFNLPLCIPNLSVVIIMQSSKLSYSIQVNYFLICSAIYIESIRNYIMQSILSHPLLHYYHSIQENFFFFYHHRFFSCYYLCLSLSFLICVYPSVSQNDYLFVCLYLYL